MSSHPCYRHHPCSSAETLTRRTGGQDYHSYRLVPSERDGDKVRQRTLLNLGSDFDLPKEA